MIRTPSEMRKWPFIRFLAISIPQYGHWVSGVGWKQNRLLRNNVMTCLQWYIYVSRKTLFKSKRGICGNGENDGMLVLLASGSNVTTYPDPEGFELVICSATCPSP